MYNWQRYFPFFCFCFVFSINLFIHSCNIQITWSQPPLLPAPPHAAPPSSPIPFLFCFFAQKIMFPAIQKLYSFMGCCYLLLVLVLVLKVSCSESPFLCQILFSLLSDLGNLVFCWGPRSVWNNLSADDRYGTILLHAAIWFNYLLPFTEDTDSSPVCISRLLSKVKCL